MSSKNGKKNGQPNQPKKRRLHPDALKSIWGIIFLGSAVIIVLAWFGYAGPAGNYLFKAVDYLLGWGYFFLPLSLAAAGLFILSAGDSDFFMELALLGIGLFLLALLGLVELFSPGHGGFLGLILGSLRIPFGAPAAATINVALGLMALIIALNFPLRIKFPALNFKKTPQEPPTMFPGIEEAEEIGEDKKEEAVEKNFKKDDPVVVQKTSDDMPKKEGAVKKFKNYVPPPLELLTTSSERPTTGDLRANANIIKRTLESFGMAVEMGEINIGPKVTRYTLKPAEGVKLSKITGLNQDLALALAAHPIRIEAPIPGKSLVGIEIPNKTAAVVRLGNLLSYTEFQKKGILTYGLGRDVTGDPVFTNVESMPHLLIAGATGSGKSVALHSLIVSLLYKNSPADLKLIMIDPKRVELSVYEGLPHLVGSVITDSKKSLSVFRWAIKEMEDRYEILLKAGRRDIKSYNAGKSAERLPYILIIVDELADLMSSYGREVEGSIIRIAQMARATGIHLVMSTQRPSVEVITGLIKANITTRIALQVASQIDSRTILDSAGAEKLLGAGDLLFVSSEYSRPKRLQGVYISEEEIRSVADFIREHNIEEPAEGSEKIEFGNVVAEKTGESIFEEYAEDEEDELYEEAVNTVREAKKASASLLQRRLKVGYARAARLLDIMEMRGVIGPGEGAKPREVYLEEIDNAEGRQ